MNLDQEIRGVEERIARERDGLALLAEDWAGAARDAVVSRKSLFAVAAFGFVLGDALRPRRPGGRARKLGMGGMLAGIAFAVLRARFGSPWALAEVAWRGWRTPTAQRAERAALAVPTPEPVAAGPRQAPPPSRSYLPPLPDAGKPPAPIRFLRTRGSARSR